MGKPQIDVATMAIPRGTTAKCIRSLCQHWVDMDDFDVRWICHLDQCDGLEDRYEDEMKEIVDVRFYFNRSIILPASENQGFPLTLIRLMWLVSNDVLWSEDDWLYEKDFSLRNIRAQTKDVFSMANGRVSVGATHPVFWRLHFVRAIREEMRGEIEYISEDTIKMLARKLKFRTNSTNKNVPYCKHIGYETMQELGILHNWRGQRTSDGVASIASTSIASPQYDHDKKVYIKQ